MSCVCVCECGKKRKKKKDREQVSEPTGTCRAALSLGYDSSRSTSSTAENSPLTTHNATARDTQNHPVQSTARVLSTMSFLLATQLTALTRQVGRMRLQLPHTLSVLPATATATATALSSTPIVQVRCLATRKKKKQKQSKSAAAAQQASLETAAAADNKTAPGVALQHEEWVQFQKSIAVTGFETGQTVVVRAAGNKKSRGGKARKRTGKSEVEERLAERKRVTDVGGGEYPPLRYSDEETARLLEEAYAAIPERQGKRGTRNLKRQGRRWHLVRKIHSKYKYHMAKAQTRKMKERSLKIQQVKAVLLEAPTVIQQDRAYQAQVLRAWAANMVRDQQDADEVEVVAAEVIGATVQDKL